MNIVFTFLWLLLAPPGVTPTVVESALSAAEFDAAMARGPQRVVASVEVQPALEKGRFLGFRIVRLQPDGDFRSCTSLLPGDVVLTVNREPLERPEQFMRAWEVVKASRSVEVELQRGTSRMLYRWTIQP